MSDQVLIFGYGEGGDYNVRRHFKAQNQEVI